MQDKKIKILFVCHGNICRSPMAEFYLRDIAKKSGVGDSFEIASCATSTEELGHRVYAPARKKLAECGINCDGKFARQMTKADYDYYDLIIAMEKYNVRNMARFIGDDPYKKVSLLLDYTDRPGDVADPWYYGNFDSTWKDVTEGCQGLLKEILKSR